MKRRAFTIALIVVAVALAAGGTLAYFTAEGTAKNIITTGKLAMKLYDTTVENGAEVDFPANGISGILPGDTKDKNVYVQNTGACDIYVRVKLTPSAVLANGSTGTATELLSYLEMELDTTNWTKGTDGWYYYNNAVAPGTFTTRLLDSVTFDEDMGNPYMEATVVIDVEAEAVQSANNGTSVTDATGWPSEA